MCEYGIYVGVPMSMTLQLMAAEETDTDEIVIIGTCGLDSERYFEEMETRGFNLVVEAAPENDSAVVPSN